MSERRSLAPAIGRILIALVLVARGSPTTPTPVPRSSSLATKLTLGIRSPASGRPTPDRDTGRPKEPGDGPCPVLAAAEIGITSRGGVDSARLERK